MDLDPDSGTLLRLEVIPFEMRRFRLQWPAPSDRDWLLRTLDRECRRLGAALRSAVDGEGLLLSW